MVLQHLPKRHDQSTLIVFPTHSLVQRKIQLGNLLQRDSSPSRIMCRNLQTVTAVRIGNDHHLIGREFGLGWGDFPHEGEDEEN